MKENSDYELWLKEADSAEALAPEGYDDRAAKFRSRELGDRLVAALNEYEVRVGSTELYQDGSGMAEYRVTEKGDRRPLAPVFAWIVASHFGRLVTIADCHDPELLSKIRIVLEALGLKYVPYEYLASKIYDGKCKSLVGLSWANRYFALVVDCNSDEGPIS
jgi:hypothetical protein